MSDPPKPTTSLTVSALLKDRWLLSVMIASALLGLIYNFVIMVGFGPDEPRHMEFVRLLLEERKLPVIMADGTEYRGAHSLHPPLYYLLLVPFYALARGLPGEWEWHVLRLVSLLLCVAAIPLIYQIAQQALKKAHFDNLALPASFASAQLALLPIFGMTAGIINNDSGALFCTTLFVWLLAVKFPEDTTWRSALWIGLCFGAGALTKASVPLCTGSALLIYFCIRLRARRSDKRRELLRFSIAILVGIAVGSPWYIRNMLLYGKAVPVAAGYTLTLLPSPEHGVLTTMLHDNFPTVFAYANWSMFYSMWSQKDWIPETMRLAVYIALAAWCAIGLIGVLLLRWKHATPIIADKTTPLPPIAQAEESYSLSEPIAYWCSLGAFLINWFACLWTALFVHWGWAEGGRYILPSLFGLVIVLATGWQTVLKQRLNWAFALWFFAMIILNVVAIVHLLLVLNPKHG